MGLDKLKSIYREVPVGSTIPVEVLIRKMGGSIRDTSDFFADLASKVSESNLSSGREHHPEKPPRFFTKYTLSWPRILLFYKFWQPLRSMGFSLVKRCLTAEAPESARDRLAALIIDLVQASWDADCIDRWISSVQEAEALVGVRMIGSYRYWRIIRRVGATLTNLSLL